MASVFISHRGVDKVLAEKLATEIKAAGHKVWLDVWEINVGDQILAHMNDGLDGTGYLVLCYSAAGASPWMDIEWISALTRQLNGDGVKVLPVRLTGANGPAILRGTKCADLMKDWTKGLAELLRAIK